MEVFLTGLPDFARDFVNGLPQSVGEHAYVVGLSGELGAGKTAFVQEVAKALGVRAVVASPTYILASRYPIEHGPFRNLIHLDAYRLSPQEKDTFGWANYIQDPSNLVLAEWPQQLPGGTPKDMRVLEFTVTGKDVRDITEHYAQ